MAFTYGSVTNCKVANGQTRSEYECRFGYEVQSQSIANNTSSVKLRLQVRSINSSYKTYGYNQTTTIDGTALSAKEFDMRDTNTWQTFGERTITVTHNTNGTYSASKSGSFTTTASSGYSLKSGSASVTVAPTTISRYANFTQHYVSRVSTSSITVYWNADAECDGLQYSVNGGSWVDTSGYPEYTIYGLSENSTYNIRTKVRRKDNQLWTESGTITGTTLAKTYPSISVASKTETSITVNSSCNVEVSSTRYRIMKSGGSYGDWQTSNTFGGLSENGTYTIQVEKIGKVNGEAGYAQVDVATYYYPHCTSATDFTIGNVLTLNFYNPLNRTMDVKVIGNDGSKIGGWSGSGTTIWGFNDPNGIQDQYKSIPNSTFGYFKIQVSYGGVTHTRDVGNRYYIIGTEYPVFNNFEYEDTNPNTLRLTDNSSILINGYSNLKTKISTTNKAYSNYHSPIDKYRLNVGNMSSVEEAYKNDAQVEMTINNINSPSIAVTAIDKRGLSQTVTKISSFKDYSKPVIKSMNAIRSNSGVGSEVTLEFSGEWWNDNFGKVQNSITSIKYYYKKTTDNNWTQGNVEIIPTISQSNFSGNVIIEGPTSNKGFDVSTAYNIKMVAIDELSQSTEYQVTLGKGSPALAIYESGVAINQMYDENDYNHKLQVNGGARIVGPISRVEDVTCKNLLYTPYTENNKLTWTATRDDDLIETGCCCYLYTDTLYNLSCESDANFDGDAEFFLKYNDTYDYYIWCGGKKNNNFTVNREGYYYLRVDNNRTGNTRSFWNFQIEEGPIATEWVQHKKFSNQEEYLKVEQVIGTYFGRTLYRRTFYGNFTGTVTYLGVIPNFDTLIRSYGSHLVEDMFWTPTDVAWNDDLKSILQVNRYDGQVLITHANANHPYHITIEYVKTTD